ncbi:unnamed protein product, partial [Amoebophrya sp. A25]
SDSRSSPFVNFTPKTLKLLTKGNTKHNKHICGPEGAKAASLASWGRQRCRSHRPPARLQRRAA